MEADSLPWFYPDRPKISWNKICHSPSQLPSFCWGGSSWCKVLADGCFSRCLVFQHERTHHQLIAPNLGVFGVWYCYAILWIHQNGFSHLAAQWWKGPPTMVNRWVLKIPLLGDFQSHFPGKKRPPVTVDGNQNSSRNTSWGCFVYPRWGISEPSTVVNCNFVQLWFCQCHQDTPELIRELSISMIPSRSFFLSGKDVPSQSSEFAHPDIVSVSPTETNPSKGSEAFFVPKKNERF